jgi:hypothetical protein
MAAPFHKQPKIPGEPQYGTVQSVQKVRAGGSGADSRAVLDQERIYRSPRLWWVRVAPWRPQDEPVDCTATFLSCQTRESRHNGESGASLSYFYGWQGLNDIVPWNMQPDDYVFVHYAEPDADLLYGSWLAAEGAPHSIISTCRS